MSQFFIFRVVLISCLLFTARKNIFSFSKCFEKMIFPKISHWNMIFLVSRRMILLFPGNMILFFRHKKKDDLSQKVPGNIIFSSNVLKRLSFQNIRAWTRSLLKYLQRWYFFFFKIYEICSLGGKWKKMIFIKKRVAIWYFLYICVGVTGVILPAWKKTKMLRKTTPKGDISGITEKDDIHSRFILFLLKYHIHWHPRKCPRSSHRKCSARKGVLRNFAKFTGKDLCQATFLIKLQT